MSTTVITAVAGSQMVIATRTINAPREIVFKTVSDPLMIPHWWGPRRLTTKVIKMVAMPGGSWRFLQSDNDGKEYGFHGVYHDVAIPERLVYTMEYEGMPGHATLNIDQFDEKDGITIMTSKTVFQSVEDRDQMLQWGMEEGTTEITNRLNELLENTTTSERQSGSLPQNNLQGANVAPLSITRIFDASPQSVWQYWTIPDKYMCWASPKDFTAPFASFDLRIGGKYLNCMRGPDGTEYWSTGIYKVVDEPHRLLYTDLFADEHGNVVPSSHYGMDYDIPLEMEVEVTFEDLGGKTRMRLEHRGFTDGEMNEKTRQGWNECFDKLTECLR